jgi:tRNA pseudouridine38-40 synthase
MYKGDDLQYLNKAGEIPDICVVKRGERRKNAFRDSRRFDLTSFAADDTAKMDAVEESAADLSEGEEELQSKDLEG